VKKEKKVVKTLTKTKGEKKKKLLREEHLFMNVAARCKSSIHLDLVVVLPFLPKPIITYAIGLSFLPAEWGSLRARRRRRRRKCCGEYVEKESSEFLVD